MEQTDNTNELSIFISHRHVDKATADVFREAIEDWSNGMIDVYQSSNAENASRIAEDLDDAIAAAIANSSIVLLIYTDAPGDMDWCMYECGLAQDPQSRTTKVAVFHTTDEPPDPLDGLISMRLSEDSVYRFTHAFHTEEEFFPLYGKAFAPRIDKEQIEQRAAELFEKLKHEEPEKPQTFPVYDHIMLGLKYEDAERLKIVDESDGKVAAYAEANRLLPDACKVRAIYGDAQEHFAFVGDQIVDTPFGKMVERWRRDSEFTEGAEWDKDLYEAITRAILNRPEKSLSSLMSSLTDDGELWILPLLASYRTIPNEKLLEFEVLFCKTSANAADAMVPPPPAGSD